MAVVDADKARRLIDEGMSVRAVARLFGVTPVAVRRYVDPEYRAKLNEQSRQYAERQRHAKNHQAEPRPPEVDAEARQAEIPSDTRGFTSRFLGDPLPGRSALDRRKANV